MCYLAIDSDTNEVLVAYDSLEEHLFDEVIMCHVKQSTVRIYYIDSNSLGNSYLVGTLTKQGFTIPGWEENMKNL